MSQVDPLAEMLDSASEYWDTHPTLRATILTDMGYEIANLFDCSKTPFNKLAPWAQRLVVKYLYQ